MQALSVFSLLLAAASSGEGSPLDACNVVWDAPSHDSSGSMPLGNGDIGLNVWVEEGGDLLSYISKTDAWDENARLVKLGRIRVKLTPNPFAKGAPYSQSLLLRDGVVEIKAGAEAPIVLRVWVDATRPIVRIEAEGAQPFEASVSLEMWRTQERVLGKEELFSAYGMAEAPHPVIVMPDTLAPIHDNRVTWYHRNVKSIWPESMKLQGMDAWAQDATDPLLNRTYGGMIEGDGLAARGDTTLASEKLSKTFRATITVLTAQTANEKEWLERVAELRDSVHAVDWNTAFDQHRAWWRAFWDRSWIRVTGAADTDTVTRGYTLQRYVTACAGRGAYPIKFNGSIFTVDATEKDKHFDADYRRWGGPYWFQNTRLPYWSMPASGDTEMMLPLFRMYLDALPFAQVRTKTYFNHDGAFFPETMYFWGGYANDNYGWKREGHPAAYIDNTYIRYYYSGALELLALMLEYHAYTNDNAFATSSLLSLADAVLQFYDQHYPRDTSGKLLLKPGQSLETWQQVVNPAPDIAGLRYVLDRLLALPDDLVDESHRAAWTKLRNEAPGLPRREVEGVTVLSPAQEILEKAKNAENPELYAIFPYRLYGVGKPDLELARRTFEKRMVKGAKGWQQDDTQAALLGLAAQARDYVAKRFATKDEGSRFPAFWGPNFDWIPDQDHGANGVMALQTMLLQCEGRAIRMFPAWPKDWDVDFKLNAPFDTVVEGVYRGGKVEHLKVTPLDRRSALDILEPQ
ncbi:MAG: hypothetical protein HZB26_06455 [Candidatus Hydrogenedentes bacterium]|nr:hypothetical protein [Candidatus Hydrogenedentota bacterium]